MVCVVSLNIFTVALSLRWINLKRLTHGVVQPWNKVGSRWLATRPMHCVLSKVKYLRSLFHIKWSNIIAVDIVKAATR